MSTSCNSLDHLYPLGQAANTQFALAHTHILPCMPTCNPLPAFCLSYHLHFLCLLSSILCAKVVSEGRAWEDASLTGVGRDQTASVGVEGRAGPQLSPCQGQHLEMT